MFERSLVHELVKRLREERAFIQIVMGPRQTGKSTAVTQALSSINSAQHFIAVDKQRNPGWNLIQEGWSSARELAQDHSEALLVFDEIQDIDDWSRIVKALWDEDTRLGVNIKVVLSGSSSLLLQEGLAESLMGRYEVIHSPHWSYSECREAFGYSLEDFIQFGGYPGASRLVNDYLRWTRYMATSIVEPTITKDILAMTRIKKPALLRQLFEVGSRYSGQEISYTKLLGQLHDAGNTVTLAHYLDLLSRAGMLCGLQKYSGSVQRSQKSSPRLLIYDTSLYTYSMGYDRNEMREFLNSHSPERGHLIESAVGAYLLARSKSEMFNLYWWRERQNEVDFVIEKGERLTAIEVKSGRIKNLNGHYEFLRRYPDAMSLIVGTPEASLEAFLLGEVPLFKTL